MAISVGQLVGNYRLQSLLGRGGFADVYLAEHLYLGTHVAIKVLSMRLTSDTIELFSKEARTVANLVHSHILRVLDFGIEHGIPYLVMDYARNGTLRQRHPKGSMLPLDTIISYVKQIASALQYIHDRKLIHRDIKPENLLIGRDGEILIGDFGIAIVAHSTRSLNTEGASGTIYYMAPEQIQGRPRPASDQYALGVLVYEWLCGTPPFTGTAMEIGMQHLLTTPPPLHGKSSMVSYTVEQVILTALAKDPHQRFEDIQTFAHALEQASAVPVGTPIYIYTGHSLGSPYSGYSRECGVSSVLWSPDGKHVASVGWNEGVEAVHIWDATDGVQTKVFRPSPQTVQAIIWKGNILHVAATEKPDRLLKIKAQLIDIESEKRITINHDWDCLSDLESVTWSPDGEFIAFVFGHTIYEGPYDEAVAESYSYDNVEIRATSTGEKVGEYLFNNIEEREIPPVAWSPDSLHIAFGLYKEVIIWEVNTQKVILSFPAFAPQESAIVWSPDGKYLAIGYEGEVKIINALTGVEVLTYLNYSRTTMEAPWVTAIARSPDSSTTSIEPAITIKQPGMSEPPSVPPNYVEQPWVTAIAWSPNSKRIISAYRHSGSDTTIHIWNTTTGENIVTRHTQFGRVVSMDWSPDGRRIAVAFEIGQVEIWCAE